MNFFSQLSTWWIVGAAVLILIVQTVLFKLVLDRSQSAAPEEPEPAGADSLGALPTANEASFATASRGNRPRRRKHLQPAPAGGAAATGESPRPEAPEPAAIPSPGYSPWSGSSGLDPVMGEPNVPISLLTKPSSVATASDASAAPIPRLEEASPAIIPPPEADLPAGVTPALPTSLTSTLKPLPVADGAKSDGLPEGGEVPALVIAPLPSPTEPPAALETAPHEPVTLSSSPEPDLPPAVAATTPAAPPVTLLMPELPAEAPPLPVPPLAPTVETEVASQNELPEQEQATAPEAPAAPAADEPKVDPPALETVIPAIPLVAETPVQPLLEQATTNAPPQRMTPADPSLTTTKPPVAATAAPPAPSEVSPPATSESFAKPPATPPKAPPAGPGIRRAVGPPRLFLTREFSSLRIRSRNLTATPAEPTPVLAAETVSPETPMPPAPDAPEPEPAVGQLVTPADAPPAQVEAVAEPVSVLAPEEPSPSAEAVSATDPTPAPPVALSEEPTYGSPSSRLRGLLPRGPRVFPSETVPASAITAEKPASSPPIDPSPEPEPTPAAPTATGEPLAEDKPEPISAPPTPEPEPPSPIPETVETPAPAHAPEPPAAGSEAPATDAPALLVPEAAPAEPESPEIPETVPVPDLPSAVDNPPAPAIIPPVPSDLISLSPTTTNMPTVQPGADERASAQITLSFEVSSLQLTPAFKLGSVQVRPLNNVVSLQLGAGAGPQPAANPLAANVSFEILSVQTGADSRIQSLVLRPLPQAQAATTPQPRLQVNAVQLTRGVENAPIQITPAQQTSTSVQILATCTIAGIDFTPLFEVGSMRLEPNSNTVLLRLTSPQAGGADLPPVFEIASVQLGGDGQIAMVQLTPISA